MRERCSIARMPHFAEESMKHLVMSREYCSVEIPREIGRPVSGRMNDT